MSSLKKFREMTGLPDTVRTWKQAAVIVRAGQKALVEQATGAKPMAKSEAESSHALWEPPRITNPRVERQMRGRGFKFKDGYPVHLPPGGSGSTFETGECTYKYNKEGALFLVWERTSWNEQREVQYEPIIDQPLVLGVTDGRLAESMFRFHHGWIDAMESYREKKLDSVRNVSPKIAAKRVAWIDDGEVVYTTTIGKLLAQSLSYIETGETQLTSVPAIGESKLTPGEDQRDNGPSAWRPVWSKEPKAEYRELQNIPADWGAEKVVLMWRGVEDWCAVRVFGQFRNALIGLFGTDDLPGVTTEGGKRDFLLTREQYKKAEGSA